MKFFIFVIVIIILSLVFITLEKIIDKLFDVERKKISETPGKNIDRWGRSIILVVFLCALGFAVTKDTDIIKWYWIVYLALLLGFQAFLEWKYLRNSKQYVATLVFLTSSSAIIIFYINYFIQLLGWG
ncbi:MULTISPECIES: DUF4181 domain-containing protein [Bacillaceae]|uniref:DUF4181 domain-containing protein n=1 Tax=Bacillaceae TaxID=186817 RepID=UPI000E7396D5|nr:DUF4181 domain-containing protein [Bacillus sp. PK3_68]RJS59275.1 hypothetical protein CJ483_03665 [Bacillus sp. PK3_68]